MSAIVVYASSGAKAGRDASTLDGLLDRNGTDIAVVHCSTVDAVLKLVSVGLVVAVITSVDVSPGDVFSRNRHPAPDQCGAELIDHLRELHPSVMCMLYAHATSKSQDAIARHVAVGLAYFDPEVTPLFAIAEHLMFVLSPVC